jgi:hypothetical protein
MGLAAEVDCAVPKRAREELHRNNKTAATKRYAFLCVLGDISWLPLGSKALNREAHEASPSAPLSQEQENFFMAFCGSTILTLSALGWDRKKGSVREDRCPSPTSE